MVFNKVQNVNVYRLFTELLTGSTCGPGFYRPTNGCIWILDVLGLWQLFGLSSTVVGGSKLEGLLSFSPSFWLFGGWLVVTLLSIFLVV